MCFIKEVELKHINEIIRFVREGKEHHESILDGGGFLSKLVEYYDDKKLNLNKVQEKLNNYLKELDEEIVKTIKIVMCLGKYNDYDSNSKNIYKSYRENIISNWRGLEVEIDFFIKNVELIDKNLIEGLLILGITY